MRYNNSNRSTLLPVLLALTLAGGILIGIYLPKQNLITQNTGIRPRSDKITNILNFIESDYVDSIDRKDLVEAAIPAILKNLDPHSVYIPADAFPAITVKGNRINVLPDKFLIKIVEHLKKSHLRRDPVKIVCNKFPFIIFTLLPPDVQSYIHIIKIR